MTNCAATSTPASPASSPPTNRPPAARRSSPASHTAHEPNQPRAPLLDVPVVWPGNARWTIHAPLTRGDTVLVVFCERDISRFKATLTAGAAPTDRVLSLNDSVAVPTLSPTLINTQPVTNIESSLTIQSADGATRIVLQHRSIRLEVDTDDTTHPLNTITVTDAGINISANSVTIRYPGGRQQWPAPPLSA